MIVDKKLLDDLSAQAKANPRLRQAMDLRNSPEDMSQRMLNAIEPGTVMSIHRHLASSETVTLLRGKVRWHFYDDAGNKTEIVILDANGDVRCINVEKGRWHSLECMESGSVLGKDPEKWLAHTLKHIGSTKPENLHRLLPEMWTE
jgi:cupin fold WbuC family metalloprotein